MTTIDEKISKFALDLFKCEAVKFGDFKMKSGSNSPIYFDLRVIISYPELMESAVDLIHEITKKESNIDLLCGVPYTALPIATILSVKTKIPMLIRRKEAKTYGTKKLIEGKYNASDNCLIIEDVITTGSSILETVTDLRKESLIVNKAVVILDREQGGSANLKSNDIQVMSILKMSKFIEILQEANLISSSTIVKIEEYLKHSGVSIPASIPSDVDKSKLSFEERSKLAINPVSKKLFDLMSEKRSNLCLAADVTTCDRVLHLLKETGPYICILKLHIDILEDFNEPFIFELKALAEKYKVVLMEDRKYGDIGNTVQLQYTGGLYKVEDWAHTVTVHALPGPGILQAIASTNNISKKGVFIVAEMSSEGTLTTPQYIEASVKLANDNLDIVAGIVCQTKGVSKSPGLIQLTPGVQLNGAGDGLGQQYNTPEKVIMENYADIAVVGRGIIKAQNPGEEAKLYRDKLWQCYKARISS